MSEADAIRRAGERPATTSSLAADLTRLGIRPGMTLVVHSSLSSLGWVCGGPVTVIDALEQVLGPEGTLVVPTHTAHLSDPAEWLAPPVPGSWHDIIRTEMPAFDAAITPTRGMGAIPECFRPQPGVFRSNHPHDSFAARGPLAEHITSAHQLDFGLGESSPLARVYEQDGYVLLLGVGHARNTSLHLAEYRAEYPGKKEQRCGAPLTRNGNRQWTWFRDINIDSSDFEDIGTAFAQTGSIVSGKVARSNAQLMSQRILVDFAVGWIETNRS